MRMDVGVGRWREKGRAGRVEAWGEGGLFPESAFWDDAKRGNGEGG